MRARRSGVRAWLSSQLLCAQSPSAAAPASTCRASGRRAEPPCTLSCCQRDSGTDDSGPFTLKCSQRSAAAEDPTTDLSVARL